MYLFIEKIPKNTFVNKPSFIISTVGVINAFGPFIIRKRLNTLGIKLKWHYVYYTINNTKNKKATKEMLDLKHTNKNNSFLKFINNIIKNEPYIKGVGPWLIGGYLVRLILKKPIEYHYKTFRVDTSICSNCLLCVRKCPMGAITYDENKYCFSNKCTTCFRCVNRCPKNAIYEIKNA
jgi:NAD-dependent dihydropyrimidine dehydrogenase PreA subunit